MTKINKWKECILILDITTILFILISQLSFEKPGLLICSLTTYMILCCLQISLMRSGSKAFKLVLILFSFKIIPIWLCQNSFQTVFYIQNLIQMNTIYSEIITQRDNHLYLIILSVFNIASKFYENDYSWNQEIFLQIIQSLICLFICLQHQQIKKTCLPLLVEQNLDQSHLIKIEQKDINRLTLRQLENELSLVNYLIFDKKLVIKRLSIDLQSCSISIQSQQELLYSILHEKIKACEIDLQFASAFGDKIKDSNLFQLINLMIESENTQLELNCDLDSPKFNSIFSINVQLCQEDYELIILINIQRIVKRKLNLEEIFQLLMKSVSHEFGTNLNCINSLANAHLELVEMSSLLKDNLLTPIIQNCDIMNIISQNLSDFEQLQNSTLILKVEKFNLFDELQLILNLYSESCKVKQIKLEIECNLGSYRIYLDDDIYTDKQRLRQVFLQIFSNSVRFTRRGWIRIKANIFLQNIEISVSDSGIGMVLFIQLQNDDEQAKLQYLLSEGYLQKISVNSVGAGLGLYISNQIVIQMNKCSTSSLPDQSTIEFKSQEGIGSEFRFKILNCDAFVKTEHLKQHQGSILRLPQVNFYLEEQGREISEGMFESYKIRSSSLRDTVHKNMSQLNTLERKFQYQSQSIKLVNCCSKILIIDDEYFNLFAMTKLLMKFTKHVDIAFNGQEALEIIKLKQECQICKSNSFRLFFIDINMPIMNGIETVKVLKQMMFNNEIRKAICIANSAFSDVDTNESAYINNSFKFNHFIYSINHLIHKAYGINQQHKQSIQLHIYFNTSTILSEKLFHQILKI